MQINYGQRRSERGNILFLILLAVVLFAAFSYAVTNSMRGGGNEASKEKALLTEADVQGYISLVENAVMRLTMSGGCTTAQVSYETPSGTGVNPDAPSDKRCHVYRPEGGGVTYRDLGSAGCVQPLTSLSVGQACGSLIHAGVSGGNRIYVMAAAVGSYNYGPSGWTAPNSNSDGLANTNTLVLSSPANYPAAHACRALGPKWYWPARDELVALCANKSVGALNGTLSGYHVASNQADSITEVIINMNICGTGTTAKSNTGLVRCMRRD